ncbi:conserved membrane protein of unknown function [Rhodovastum atsumiense]|uniref:FUSC family protein n=1 Tax=Rhodovastum atsumiense TaxID=504468 RepID=A0A5M6IQU6_9PROT|nr:FUSC family protein [Rhodovastum atsumiense]KAA5610660.1 hypothetical protein F1189_17955 [Rhodovastum atsumiense]CAH2603347.1 conserved membrane protein of unknown function [Rhodovastum atsumiense]
MHLLVRWTPGLSRAEILHGCRLAFAAWLAFTIASFLHVENAFWAAMPVWVVAQSAKGLLLERAFYRIAGTLIGAAAGFGLLRLGGGPYMALALLGLWVGLAGALAQMLRGVHAYGAMMAGMSAAVVALPAVLNPALSYEFAIARVECTLVGVVVVTLVTALWTPDSPRAEFYGRVRQLGRDAVDFAAAVLRGLPPEAAEAREREILRELAEVQETASLVTAGSIEGYRRLHHVQRLTLAALAVMAEARAYLARQQAADDAALAAHLSALAGTLLAPEPPEPDLAPVVAADPALAEAVARLVAVEAAFRAEPDSADARSFGSKVLYLAPWLDVRLAAEAGLLAGGATTLAGMLGYASGWGPGELAALGICIFSMVLSSMPAPERFAPMMLKGVLAGVAAALLYRFLVQPHVTTLPMLSLSLVPFLLAGGLARAARRTAGPAIDANMCFMLAGQAVLPPVTDAFTILNETSALLLAAVVATTGFRFMPPRAPRQAARALRAIRRDLRRLAQAGGGVDVGREWARGARQVLRLGLHLDRAATAGASPGSSLLAVLNLGLALLDLRELAARDAAAGAALDAFRRLERDPDGVAAELERRAEDAAEELAGALRTAAAALRASRGLLGDPQG